MSTDAQTSPDHKYAMMPVQSRFGRVISGERLVWLLAVGLVALLVLAPLAVLVVASFKSGNSPFIFTADNFTLQNYVEVFSSPTTYSLLYNSVVYTFASVAISMVIACVFAYFIQRTNIPFRRVLLILLISPMAIPAAVSGMAWVLLGSSNIGLYNVWIRAIFGLEGRGPFDVYGMGGMILVTSIAVVPSFFLIIAPVFNKIDVSFEEASEACGASKLRTLQKVTLPLLTPALLGAAIFFFIVVIETFEIPAILGMPKRVFVFSTLVYQSLNPDVGGLPNYGVASTYGVVTLIITLALLYLYSRVLRNSERFSVVTGKNYRPRILQMKPSTRWIVFGILFAYLVFAVIIPFLVLVWASLQPFYSVPTAEALSRASLAKYAQLFNYPGIGVATRNTAILVLFGASGAMVVAALVSRLSVRSKVAGNKLPEHLAMLVIAVPGVILALALQLVYASVPLPIYGTIWIIVIACVTRFLANGTRALIPAFLQVHPALEEASSASGVPPTVGIRRVLLPLVMPAMLSFWLWAAVQSAREIPMSIALAKAESQTLGVALWNIWTQSADIGLASSLAVLLTLASAVGTFFVARFIFLPNT